MSIRTLFCLLALCAFPVAPAFAAGSGNPSDEWEFLVEPYGWFPEVTVEDKTGEEFKLTLDDLIRGADFAYEVVLGARKNKWTFFLDTIYMDLSWDDDGSANLIGRPVHTDVEIDMKVWLVTLLASYAFLETEKTRLEVLFGVQFLSEDIGFEFDVGPLGEKIETDFNALDGLVGLRGVTDLSEKWYVSYYGSIGTGESDLVWNAQLGVNRKFRNVTAYAGWRHADFEMDEGGSSGGQLINGQYATGPVLGAKWIF